MPSPFPGMDPFLEHPEIFPDLHDRFNTYLSEFLQSRLPPPYYATIRRQVWIETSHRFVEPDVHVIRPRRQPAPSESEGGSVAVATRPSARKTVVVVEQVELSESRLEIYTGRGTEKRLVTTLEVLSLSNKTPGAHGRDRYRQKQQEMLSGYVHLVEIDLLRAGEHMAAVPRDAAVAETGEFDYHVCVHRFDRLEEFVVYPILLEESLPEIDIPLLPGDASVQVDLQAVFDRCYDTGPYPREIRYLEDALVPPLSPEREAWARSLLEAVDAQPT